jgi:plastocyanin
LACVETYDAIDQQRRGDTLKATALTALTALGVAGALLVALPASAATPTFKGTVGPGYTITMASKPKKAGTIKLVVADKASIHNFHLTGPGVNVKTSVSGTGSKTFTVTLKKGTYKFVCDPHSSSMKGSFTIK